MPSDSNQCRKRAARCIDLSKRAKTENEKSHLLGLAHNWETLATEFERPEDVTDGQPSSSLMPLLRR
jgi:hypothetical protein